MNGAPIQKARDLIDALHSKPALQQELTFYASFAHKSFALMQREGPEKDGFSRLQQSFRDAVERVRTILGEAKIAGFPADNFLELSPAGMANMMGLITELAHMHQASL
ncbi:MAG TPA: hypothetical protein VGM92_08370 [Candidatus Kapabacteria bacterium]